MFHEEVCDSEFTPATVLVTTTFDIAPSTPPVMRLFDESEQVEIWLQPVRP